MLGVWIFSIFDWTASIGNNTPFHGSSKGWR